MNITIELPSAVNDCSKDAVAKFAFKRVLNRLETLFSKTLDLWHNLMRFKIESEYFRNPSETSSMNEEFLNLWSHNRQLFNEICEEYAELSQKYQTWKTAFGETSPHFYYLKLINKLLARLKNLWLDEYVVFSTKSESSDQRINGST